MNQNFIRIKLSISSENQQIPQIKILEINQQNQNLFHFIKIHLPIDFKEENCKMFLNGFQITNSSTTSILRESDQLSIERIFTKQEKKIIKKKNAQKRRRKRWLSKQKFKKIEMNKQNLKENDQNFIEKEQNKQQENSNENQGNISGKIISFSLHNINQNGNLEKINLEGIVLEENENENENNLLIYPLIIPKILISFKQRFPREFVHNIQIIRIANLEELLIAKKWQFEN
ncbi:hypothetical protein M0811_09860 [Anaeramoeba ignava]|uniref:Uncharacterized protein n=1 Tax=Anaeramoeba ignava TaxID=1746090 RepID=A0A9Q0LIT0_ANAIG|nr:hypothetical protein M0811_09860 [Anaeramoeba ignava]